MSTSPVSPEDIRAAAAAHQELGPEYSDAVVAAFLARVDRAVDARVAARLAAMQAAPPAAAPGRRTLVKGIVIGACGGVLATALAFTGLAGGSSGGLGGASAAGRSVHVRLMPFRTFNGVPHVPFQVPAPPPAG